VPDEAAGAATPAQLAESRARILRRLAEKARRSQERYTAKALREDTETTWNIGARADAEIKRKEIAALCDGAAALEEIARTLRRKEKEGE
jgi:hypothetical protein